MKMVKNRTIKMMIKMKLTTKAITIKSSTRETCSMKKNKMIHQNQRSSFFNTYKMLKMLIWKRRKRVVSHILHSVWIMRKIL